MRNAGNDKQPDFKAEARERMAAAIDAAWDATLNATHCVHCAKASMWGQIEERARRSATVQQRRNSAVVRAALIEQSGRTVYDSLLPITDDDIPF